MAVIKKKSTGVNPSRVVRSLIIVAAAAILLGVSAKMSMNSLNRKMGLESDAELDSADTVITEANMEVMAVSEFDPNLLMETGSSIWAPGWKSTPCSIFIAGESDALLDSLPESPDPVSKATELQLLVELWADYSGFEAIEIERVWVFSSGDTCFVDLPRSADWQSIVRTIESRFISYTVMFPFVAGEIIEGFEGGIPVRGVPTSR